MRRLVSASLLALSLSLAAPGLALARTAVAVLDLEAPEKLTEVSSLIAEAINSELFKSGRYTVVERRQVSKIFREQGLAQTGAVREDTAVQMGQVLGVKQLVVGSVGALGTGWRVDARLVDAESARVIAAATVQIQSRDAIALGARELVAALSAPGSAPALDAALLKGAATELGRRVGQRFPKVKARLARVDETGWAVADSGTRKGLIAGMKLDVYGRDFTTGDEELKGFFLVKTAEEDSAGGPTKSLTEPLRAGDTIVSRPMTLTVSGASAAAEEAVAAALRGLPQFELAGPDAEVAADVSVEGSAIGGRRLVIRLLDKAGTLLEQFESRTTF